MSHRSLHPPLTYPVPVFLGQFFLSLLFHLFEASIVAERLSTLDKYMYVTFVHFAYSYKLDLNMLNIQYDAMVTIWNDVFHTSGLDLTRQYHTINIQTKLFALEDQN